MLQERNTLRSLRDTTSNTFINVLEKVQNKQVGNDTAWEVAQPLLHHYIPEYPETYKDHLGFVRELFGLRRDDFRDIDQDAYKKAKALILELKPEEEDLLRPVIVCIRDVFDIKAGDRRDRRKFFRESSKKIV